MRHEKVNKIVLINLAILLLFTVAFNIRYSNYSIAINESNDSSGNIDLESTSISTSGTSKTYWEANGTIICNELQTQRAVVITSDENGGAIIVWSDYRDIAISGIDVYAQKIDSNGKTKWGDNGTVICNAPGNQAGMYFPTICSDMMGGAIIAWTDPRSGDYNFYAQRIDENGKTLWDDNGTVVCNATGTTFSIEICSDGANGAIFAWWDPRSDANGDVYAQHIDSNGNAQWGDGSFWVGKPDRNGTVICNATDLAFMGNVDICSDGVKGAIVSWQDKRIDSDGDIYAQHINSTGHTLWGDGSFWGVKPDRNGTIICNTGDIQTDPKICKDGNNGAFITWTDNRFIGTRGTDIYAQHVDSLGQTSWGEPFWGFPGDLNGTVVCNSTGNQNIPLICYDGENGAIITWQDMRYGNPDNFVQRIDSNGNYLWDDNGTVICNDPSLLGEFQMISDGHGSAIITWRDNREGTDDIYAQKINKNGKTLWDSNGTVVCNTNNDEYKPSLCSDNNGGAIITWDDNADVYAQRIGDSISSRIILSGDDDDDDDDDDEEAIPFGNYYLLFAILAIVALIIIYKRKPVLSNR